MKEIKKNELETLVNNRVVRNSKFGYVNRYGDTVGFYKTRNKMYIEDKYVDMARKLT